MVEYANEFSNFPSELITRHNFKNVTDSVSSIINQINTLRSQGQYGQAAILVNDNQALLSQHIIDAITLRTLEEEIYNTQIYAQKSGQGVYLDETEPDCLVGDIWVGGE